MLNKSLILVALPLSSFFFLELDSTNKSSSDVLLSVDLLTGSLSLSWADLKWNLWREAWANAVHDIESYCSCIPFRHRRAYKWPNDQRRGSCYRMETWLQSVGLATVTNFSLAILVSKLFGHGRTRSVSEDRVQDHRGAVKKASWSR